MLIPHTYPKGTRQDEQDVMILKQRHIDIDGYEVLTCLSAADYGKYNLWSLQLQAVQYPFLPFNLIVKLGKLFLGKKNLSYIAWVKENKKTYCWTCRRKGKYVLPPRKGQIEASYENFEYSLMDPESLDLH